MQRDRSNMFATFSMLNPEATQGVYAILHHSLHKDFDNSPLAIVAYDQEVYAADVKVSSVHREKRNSKDDSDAALREMLLSDVTLKKQRWLQEGSDAEAARRQLGAGAIDQYDEDNKNEEIEKPLQTDTEMFKEAHYPEYSKRQLQSDIGFTEPTKPANSALPNDPLFNCPANGGTCRAARYLWSLNGKSGLGHQDKDIDFPEAWELYKNESPFHAQDDVIVAVVDTGLDILHKDLTPQLWTNPGEIAGNGIDDDKNGRNALKKLLKFKYRFYQSKTLF